MARDMQVDLEVKPTLEVRAVRNLINTLEKELRKVQSGTHLPLAQKISSVYDKFIETGLAATPTSARIAFSKLTGGKFNERQQGVIRLAEGITAQKLSAEKSYNILQSQLERFKERPTPEGRANILRTISNIEKTVISINKSQKNLPHALKQVSQNVNGIKKEVSDWDFGEEGKQSATTNSLLMFAKKLTGITTLVSGAVALVRKGGQAVVNALTRGTQAMRLQAAYGKDIQWGDIRARAGIFNMSTEAAAAPSQYASDFQQRMLWGEISEREVIGLSRAGRWGRMIMSGEAKRNPEAANRAFEELVTSTDQAKMRSILRQLGLPQDVMQYNIQAYDQDTRKAYERRFKEMADTELNVAEMVYDAGNQLEVALQEASDALAAFAGDTVQLLSPQGRMAYARLREKNDTQFEREIDNIRRTRVANVMNNLGYNPNRTKQFWSNELPNPVNNINQTVNNNIVIQGNADSNTVDSLRDEMSRPQAISSWFEQAQIMGGRTTY